MGSKVIYVLQACASVIFFNTFVTLITVFGR